MRLLKIYHNPRCSKSRQALEILTKAKVNFEVVEYLKTPLTKEIIENLISGLGEDYQDIVRVKESEYIEHPFTLTDKKAIVSGIIKFPKILERPIVTDGKKACIGRPPEKIKSFIK